jgi:hypothetical protein
MAVIIEATAAVHIHVILPQFQVQSTASWLPSCVATFISHCQDQFKLKGLLLTHFHA